MHASFQSPSTVRIPEMEGLRLTHSVATRLPCTLRRPRSTIRAALLVATPRRETDPKKRVVVTGTKLVSVFGNDVNTFYEWLLAGESGVGPIDRFDASTYPTSFAVQIRGFTSSGYIDAKNNHCLDDCLRYCLIGGKRALESAQLHPAGAAMEKIPLL